MLETILFLYIPKVRHHFQVSKLIYNSEQRQMQTGWSQMIKSDFTALILHLLPLNSTHNILKCETIIQLQILYTASLL